MIKNYSNIAFLKKIHPVKTLVLSFVVWSLLFLFTPVKINITINPWAYSLIIFSVLAFSLGYYLKKKPALEVQKKTRIEDIHKIFKIVLVLACLGMIFKLFDRFFIRGVSLDSNFFENRESMENGGGNFFGIIAAFLVPFSYIPLFLHWKYKLKQKKLIIILVFILFFFQVFDALLLGARSVIFILGMMLLLYLFYFKKLQLTFRKIILLITGVLGFVLFMNYLFLERTKLFAGDKAYDIALNYSNFNYTLTASDEFKRDFDQKSELGKTISFSFITTSQYFLHGMFEYGYLYENFDSEHAYGSYTFIVYKRFLDKLIGSKTDIFAIQDLAPRQGVYTTFYGPLYLDFGWFMLIFMFFFGRYTSSIYEKAKNMDNSAILVYFYIFIVLLFSPVFNFVSGAGGIFLFTSFNIYRILQKQIIK